MKRKRSPSPSTRRTSRSPHSPRATRASNRSPPRGATTPSPEGKEEDTSLNSIRRSSRTRKLSFPYYNSEFLTQDDVIRNRDLKLKSEELLKNGHSRSTTPEIGMESPFFTNSHVRFSPSAKPGSPARWPRHGQRAAASIARMRLQNVPSEDEQSEFNRRYSRDLRSRRRERNATADGDDTSEIITNITKKSSRRELSGDEMAPVSRKSRGKGQHDPHEDAEDERSEYDDEHDDVKPKQSNGGKQPIRRVTRNRHSDQVVADDPEDDEDIPLGRKVLPKKDAITNNDDVSVASSEEMIDNASNRRSRASSRISKSMKDPSSTEEDDENLKSDRPKRSRVPVERYGYEAPTRQSSSGRIRRGEVRNLDQYSSDDDFVGDQSNSSRRRKQYDMRPKKRCSARTSERRKSHRPRDTSSSSSSESVDEQKFIKRKNKRMMIERSKLRPMNMSRADAAKAIFRERNSVGASMADIQPMEMDSNITFECVGGVDDHINSLREMIVFPLLYPEVFSKFSITPPRGVLFYGPPGTGKTMIARALANECSRDGRKVAFFMRKGADCLSKWIGESERQLRLLFDQAFLMRPSIIFFDEIDGLAPVRSSRNDQIHSSIVSTLLALMDGLDNRGEIIVIGATNRIENIDPALRRPGRFDRELRFGLPTRDSRRAILGLHMNSWTPPVERAMLDNLADKTIGYSGADLKGLCAEAALNALRRRYPQVYQTSFRLALDYDKIRISEVDFERAMEKLVPSTHRIQDQLQSPLVPRLRPLLASTVSSICAKLDEVSRNKEFSYRPRILIRGRPGQCVSTYIGPAVLHHLEKLPCHKLDISALFSNSARSPEEAMFQIIHEAKRTVPSVVYIPHLLKLLRRVLTDTQREAFFAMMSDIQPTAPLIVIAFTEELAEEDSDEILGDLFDAQTEVMEIANADDEQRRSYFKPIFEAALKPPEDSEGQLEETAHEVLSVIPIPESRELTEKEEKRLKRKEDELLRELRIFLRDIWQKINREQRFFMFRNPVDTEEVYDYLDIVQKPMDFDQMLTKLDNGEYSCAQDFLDDIDLISENALAYNSDQNYETNKVICHRARALQDFAYALVKAEMDTDFEDNCKEIVVRRKKLTEKLEKPPESKAFDPKTNQVISLDASTSQNANLSTADKPFTAMTGAVAKKKKPFRKSRWSSGLLVKKRKAKPKSSDSVLSTEGKEEQDESFDQSSEMVDVSNHVNGDSDSDDEVILNESKEFKVDSKKLSAIEDDLVKRTEDLATENLEKIFVKLMECVSHYKLAHDRSQLPKELMEKMENLQILRKITAAKKKATNSPQ